MTKLTIVAIACFLFGMTWDVEFRMPYYECRGFFAIEQTLFGVEASVSWPAKGFNYPVEWDVHRTHRHDWETGGHFRYNPLATIVNTKGYDEARGDFESEAVTCGHAKFHVNDEITGKREFRWNLWDECDKYKAQ